MNTRLRSLLSLPPRPGPFQAAHILLPAAAALTLIPFVSAGAALILGVCLGLALGNPYLDLTRAATHRLLAWAVMGLGAGMDLTVVGRVGARGIGYTVAGIAAAFALGALFGRIFKTERNLSILITAGTAICGGSAIAAVSPAIRAKPHEVSVALGTVFLLNAVALFAFPAVGHAFDLAQPQFGLWSALAIHDTSSVVGATLQYGAEALRIGTTVKLARALWIVPVTLAAAFWVSRGQAGAGLKKVPRPWFIAGFVAAAALVTWIPALQPAGHVVEAVAKRLLVLTLFLVGTNLTRATVRSVGVRPLVLGVTLWVLVATGTMAAILAGWIHA